MSGAAALKQVREKRVSNQHALSAPFPCLSVGQSYHDEVGTGFEGQVAVAKRRKLRGAEEGGETKEQGAGQATLPDFEA